VERSDRRGEVDELLTLRLGEARRPRLDKVAGLLKVERTYDTHEIVISYPVASQHAPGTGEIRLLPRYARHLANLLIEQATYAEADAAGTEPHSRPYGRVGRGR
jgi:hypothetical protein